MGIYQNMRGEVNLIPESLVLPKTALLILHCEVSCCHARGTSFHFRDTQVLLDEFFEPSETILPRTIPYSAPDLVEQILAE
jgi:hypothetical protein